MLGPARDKTFLKIKANVRQGAYSKAFISSWTRSLHNSNSWIATSGLVFSSGQNDSWMWARSLCVEMWTRSQRVQCMVPEVDGSHKTLSLEVLTLLTRGVCPHWIFLHQGIKPMSPTWVVEVESQPLGQHGKSRKESLLSRLAQCMIRAQLFWLPSEELYRSSQNCSSTGWEAGAVTHHSSFPHCQGLFLRH